MEIQRLKNEINSRNTHPPININNMHNINNSVSLANTNQVFNISANNFNQKHINELESEHLDREEYDF